MDGASCAPEKRSLLGARNHLQSKAKSMAELARMAEILVEKSNRTEGAIKEGKPLKGEEVKKQPDLIGMFDETADEMQSYINRIGSSLEMALNYVD